MTELLQVRIILLHLSVLYFLQFSPGPGQDYYKYQQLLIRIDCSNDVFNICRKLHFPKLESYPPHFVKNQIQNTKSNELDHSENRTNLKW